MYGGSDAPGPPTPAATPRYVYLISRLRSRQITMEEATELFAIMQSMIRAAGAARSIGGDPASPPPPPPPPRAGGFGGMQDPEVWALLGIGAGVGLGTAFLKMMADGPPAKRAAPPRPGSSST